MLSTDATREIAAIGRSLGLTVDYMRPGLARHRRRVAAKVMLDVLDWADARGIAYDLWPVAASSPPRPCALWRMWRCREALYTPECDMVTTLAPSDANPYYNIFELDAGDT